MVHSKEYNNIFVAKGIGIFLVVLGHFEGVPGYMPKYFIWLHELIYTFHMPLFMALSGFLFGKLFSSQFNYRLFIKKKVKRLLIPYFTLSLLLLIVKYTSGFFVELNHPPVLSDVLYNIFVQPNIGFAAFLWFIYTLFLIFCIVPFFKKLSHLFIVGIILFFIPFPPYFCIDLVAKYLIYFTIGIYIYRQFVTGKTIKRPFLVFVFTLLFMSALFFVNRQSSGLYKDIVLLIMATTGILSVFAFSELIVDLALFNRPFLYLGRSSSEIYLLHTFCMGLVMALAVNIPIDGVARFYMIGILAIVGGLFIPVFIRDIIVRFNIPVRLLLFGDDKK